MFYFRTRHDVEVNFIIRWKNKIYAIEAKANIVSKTDLSGLKKFKEYYPQVSQCFVVSPKETNRIQDGIVICGVPELFKQLRM